MWRSTGGALACGEGGADVAPVLGLASAGIHTPGWASGRPVSYRTAREWPLSAAWVCAIRCPQWKTTSTSAWAPQTRSSCSCCQFGFLIFLPLNLHQHLPLPSGLPGLNAAPVCDQWMTLRRALHRYQWEGRFPTSIYSERVADWGKLICASAN